nr:PREDICTED: non-homologous end-joining factor 1 [Paralichthys olivaceus]XP_019967621.1 PREDICTED: non-homologous end-joining factor 1 [Paralichthys olivaceus]
MEVNGAPADVLLQRPWLPVGISGCQLLAKIWFGDSAYHILLTDMSCVWEERMDSAAIHRRSQELNRRLRAPVRAFFSHLCEVAQPCLSGSSERADSAALISLMRQEHDNISIKLKSELAGLPFYWEFRCTPAPVTLVCVQLLRPLLAMSRLLQRQVEQLGGLLVKKDTEIQDYRENGATLSRERLQTDVFEEQTYQENFMTKLFGDG